VSEDVSDSKKALSPAVRRGGEGLGEGVRRAATVVDCPDLLNLLPLLHADGEEREKATGIEAAR
jgi:hypothetical protein